MVLLSSKPLTFASLVPGCEKLNKPATDASCAILRWGWAKSQELLADMWLPERWHHPVYWCCGGSGDSRCSASQPPSCPWGCLKPHPILLAAKAFPPLVGKSLRIILASCCPHRDLTLERVLQLWLWEQSLEEWTDMCFSVSLCEFRVSANNRWGFPDWELDMRWKRKIGHPFLGREAIYDLTHFLMKLFKYFLLILLAWTLSRQ